jgi:hypothetical protein
MQNSKNNFSYYIDAERKEIQLNGSLKLTDLLIYLDSKDIPLDKVVISSGGDPYLPTTIDWLDSQEDKS